MRPLLLIAGPCAIESKEQIEAVARVVKDAGLSVLRGGAFKPRSSPYSFQGLEEEGLELLSSVAKRFGLFTITEVTDPSHLDLVSEKVDILQVGTRNMSNFALLKKIGAVSAEKQQPVMLKRGMSATIDEWLLAAEYITSAGNHKIMLCERGIRTFETATRFTLDINAIPVVKKLTSFPVIVDPSHATGYSDLVIPVGRAAIAAGADGLMVEVHPNPKKALCDGQQSLDPSELRTLVEEVVKIAQAVGRRLTVDLNEIFEDK